MTYCRFFEKGSLNTKDVFPLILTVPTAVQTLSDELLKYYQQVTRAILGDDPHLMKVCP